MGSWVRWSDAYYSGCLQKSLAGGALINSLMLTDIVTSLFSLPCILYLVVLDEVCRHLEQWLMWGVNQQRSELHFKVFSDSLLLLVPSPLDLPPAWNARMKCSLKLWLHGLFLPVVAGKRNLLSWISNLKAKVREKITVALNNEQKYQEIYFSSHLSSLMQIFSSLKTVFQSEFLAGSTASSVHIPNGNN